MRWDYRFGTGPDQSEGYHSSSGSSMNPWLSTRRKRIRRPISMSATPADRGLRLVDLDFGLDFLRMGRSFCNPKATPGNRHLSNRAGRSPRPQLSTNAELRKRVSTASARRSSSKSSHAPRARTDDPVALLRLILRRVRQRAFVIQNPYVIPRVEIAAANVASEKVFGLADAPPVGAFADHRPARSRFFE